MSSVIGAREAECDSFAYASGSSAISRLNSSMSEVSYGLQ